MADLLITSEQSNLVIEYSVSKLPEEACGLLVGREKRVLEVCFIENVLHSPTRFYMNEKELFEALNRLEEQDSELLGIFHSHPRGPLHPSETDCKEWGYPESVVLICAPSEGLWMLYAYWVRDNNYLPAVLNFI